MTDDEVDTRYHWPPDPTFLERMNAALGLGPEYDAGPRTWNFRAPDGADAPGPTVEQLVEILAAAHIGVVTVTNDGRVTWVYTPSDADEPVERAL